MIRNDISEYVKELEITPSTLGSILGIHENSIRHFFKQKSQNAFKIIDWYLEEKRREGIPK